MNNGEKGMFLFCVIHKEFQDVSDDAHRRMDELSWTDFIELPKPHTVFCHFEMSIVNPKLNEIEENISKQLINIYFTLKNMWVGGHWSIYSCVYTDAREEPLSTQK